ncbi:unnamed protein product [Chondrus crispus]|uniref:Uncharacterized protein n=1 Tax=Chondrus crispus TaxID=2769 RepID=R7QDT6_CHOCR|nr:unnamed protein product [Chondrus crispus]CDF35580.1 unnamed protein product [Chondrus crispus]|eukprot:XP_005715399.1 unnamed protein product [Chondrus crispus]
MPSKSISGDEPSTNEKSSSTHGRYGARNETSPRNDTIWCALRRPHTYTIMKVRLGPRKLTGVSGDTTTSSPAPNRSMYRKSAVRPRNELVSSILQYRYRKNMWKRKSRLKSPKNRNVVTSRHTCPLRTISSQLRYSLNGVISSSATAPVVSTDRQMYDRVTGGIDFHHSSTRDMAGGW